MAITRTAMIDDDGTGTTGTIFNNAWKTELYNQIDAVAGGTWIDIPSGTFSTWGGGTWVVSSFTTFAYVLNGKTLHLAFHTTASTITGTPVSLDIALGWTAARTMSSPFNYFFAGGSGVGYGTGSGTLLKLFRDLAATPWAAGSCYISGFFNLNVT